MTDAVLVTDDDQRVLKSIARSLRRDGHEIQLADNGPAALQTLAEQEIAVIICDQRMPGMSGAEVLAGAAELSPDSYRIALTGYADVNAIRATINQGHINHLLLKPWDDEHLRSVVQEGVHAYKLIQDNRRLEALTRQQKEKLEAWSQQLESEVEAQTAELCAQNASLLDLQDRLERSLRDTVGLLASLLEAYSPNLGIHSMRVAELARRLGERLKLPNEELRNVECAAYLHDIGKVSKLHAESTRGMKRSGAYGARSSPWYPDCGYAILSHVSGFQDIASAVRHQGEWYDGTGRPEGLKGDGIPRASRIIALANAYDEAVFPRLSPSSAEAGRRVLLEGQGARFDPQLAALLLKCVDEQDGTIGKHAEVEMPPTQLRKGMILSRGITTVNGVLLLKEGIRLTNHHIAQVRAYEAADFLLTGVFVKCGVTAEDAGDSDASEQGERRQDTGPPSGLRAAPAAAAPGKEQPWADGSQRVTASPGSPGDLPGESGMPYSTSTTGAPTARILIVDDSRLTCMALSRDMHRAGFDSLFANTGSDAVRLVEQHHFDLALIDLAMPIMPGAELVRRLQEHAPDLPCVILTGNATKQTVLQLTKAPNVATILVKPWDYDRLIRIITSTIAQHNPKYEKERV